MLESTPIEGEVIAFKFGNVVIVRLTDNREIAVAINKNLMRKLFKISLGDRFAIKMFDSPKLPRAYAPIARSVKLRSIAKVPLHN
ncbi:hypothetical protein C7B77_06500 [Chamaesiphon polymorphus CCALA 037]|uniref:Uncharacterized protein n=1 Tax=Chamaesiphon polymorphus CCALA 037 TaxID=2107692 RepID=A0A2T1GJT8_9CYAN|nr:hypothetical protein C7B77_06500 [Chamaesiphon polymorphus CCALA 037]